MPFAILIAVLIALSGRALGQTTDFIDQSCADCHSGADPAGGLDLDGFAQRPRHTEWLAIALKASARVADGTMPPPNALEPLRAADRQGLLQWIEGEVAANLPKAEVRPGRVTTRRLSREEYRRTISALFGVALDVESLLPADDLGYGFDHIGDALSVSLLHIEKYADAAAEVADRVLTREDPDNPAVRRVLPAAMQASSDRFPRDDVAGLFSNGTVWSRFDVPRSARYRIRFEAFAAQAGPDLAKMRVDLDGQPLKEYEVRGSRAEPEVFAIEMHLERGTRTVGLSFLNDYYQPKAEDPKDRDRNLYINHCELIGPLDPYVPPTASQWVLAGDRPTAKPELRARPLLSRLAHRAFRRPATGPELTRLVKLLQSEMKAGQAFEAAFRTTFEAILLSPHFLYRVEPGATQGKDESARQLSDHALATRLSYFLWSAPPDEALLERAGKGKLSSTEELESEAKRMLADPMSEALATNFAAQWLELRNLNQITPDPARYPQFNRSLANSMRRETEALFLAVLAEDRDVRDLLRADFTHCDQQLASFYGIPFPLNAKEDVLVRVQLDSKRPRGLLGHASIHAITSNPTRTSPVKRGKWILDNLLDAAPPPPPPGADSFEDESLVQNARSLRESLALHRAKVECASCHNRMDALGFSLEGFDPIGAPRTSDGGEMIDTSGLLPNGQALKGPDDLAEALASDQAFIRCLLKKLFLHAVGRALAADDEVAIERLARSLPKERITLKDLIFGIIRLEAFQARDPEKNTRRRS